MYTSRRNREGDNQWLIKAGIAICSLVVIFFGVKLLLYPVMQVAANFLKESTESITLLVSQQNIRKEDGLTNVLLLGVDERFKGGTSLTDTIIVATYNHEGERTSMLSVPRDLWVRIPAFEGVNSYYTKINAVHSIGEQYGYSGDDLGGGVGLLAQVIEDHFGVPIHYYARVNFDGFKQAIDAIGGVDIYVDQPFTDYQYPREGYENAPWNTRWEVITFEQGWQHMDGETALKYARSRHAFGPEGTDFARAKRQQKVIIALKDKVMSNTTLFNPTYLKNLYLTLSSEMDTNIGLVELPVFYDLAKNFENQDKVKTYVLTNSATDEGGLLYSPDPAEYGGAYVLLPREGWEAVAAFVQETIFSTTETQVAPTQDTTVTPAL